MCQQSHSEKQGHDRPGRHHLSFALRPENFSVYAREGVVYRWDTAFYQGKYYCYFGIVPVLLFYLPFNVVPLIQNPIPQIVRALAARWIVWGRGCSLFCFSRPV